MTERTRTLFQKLFLRRTKAGTALRTPFSWHWYNQDHPSPTEFWATLYVLEPFFSNSAALT
jgi:hypothetical protein